MESNWLQTDFPAGFYFSSVLHSGLSPSSVIFLIKRSFPRALHCLAVVFISCRLFNLPSCRGFGPWDGPDLHIHVYTYIMVPRALPWHSSLPLREISVLLCYVKRLGKFTVDTHSRYTYHKKKKKKKATRVLLENWFNLYYVNWSEFNLLLYQNCSIFVFIYFCSTCVQLSHNFVIDCLKSKIKMSYLLK